MYFCDSIGCGANRGDMQFYPKGTFAPKPSKNLWQNPRQLCRFCGRTIADFIRIGADFSVDLSWISVLILSVNIP